MLEAVGRLSSTLGVDVPLISAPMAGVAGGALAQAVSDAGAFGMIGGGYGDPDWLAGELHMVRPETIGIGFIGWALEQRSQALDLAIGVRPRAIMLSFGGLRSFAPRITAAGIPLVAQVQTLADARAAVQEGASIVVAQGTEAGGHCGTRSTFALVPEVVDAVGEVPVVAAGGIGDGRGLAAALMLGAAGALCGTAFYVANEALSIAEAKTLLTEGSGDDTIRSEIFDVARGLNWPSKWKTRALRNPFTEKWEGDADFIIIHQDNIRHKYRNTESSFDRRISPVFCGECAGLSKTVQPASEIVRAISDGARDAVRNISGVSSI